MRRRRKKKKTTRMKERKRAKMKKGLPRGEVMTPSTHVTRRSNRVTSRGRTRATSVDNSHETPRRRLRNRTVRNPSSTTRATSAPAAAEKPKYYNSEFRKRDTQQHHLGPRTIICPYCHAYMWKDELPTGGSVVSPSFEVCCKHGKIKTPRPSTPFSPLLRNLYPERDPRSAEFTFEGTMPRWRSHPASPKLITASGTILGMFR
jgi:hypothetical protein